MCPSTQRRLRSNIFTDRRDDRTWAYVARRTVEGKSKKEIIRYPKRYAAREIYRVLVLGVASADPSVGGGRMVLVIGGVT